MKITIESTEAITHLNGVPARIWVGETESGIAVHAYITRIAVEKKENTAEFEKELEQCDPSSPEIQSIPRRMIL